MNDRTNSFNAPQSRIIGGVFSFEKTIQTQKRTTVLNEWSKSAAAVDLFHNARSALRHILTDLKISRLWLPAYSCKELEQASDKLPLDVQYFPLDITLTPNTQWLKERLNPGDAVLAINYFGRPASIDWQTLVANSDKIIWIEDCAQSMDTGGTHFGDFRIYSPRKLLGVPDGGVLVDMKGQLCRPVFSSLPNNRYLKPYQLRTEDPTGANHGSWYKAFQKAEAEMSAGNYPMSGLSSDLLQQTGIRAIIKPRITNYNYLYQELSDLALFNAPANNWAPLGFPIKLDHGTKADDLSQHLAMHRIFAPRHWQTLNSPANIFPLEHQLSKTLITLPCDQRYDTTDMARTTQVIKDFLND
ncbi:MAG: DegT/DnrJ/EryC1/StrS family aminotransferase [Arenicella sp.]